MRILIIGASGLIGHHLFSLAKEEGHNVIGTYYSQPKKGLLRYEMRTESLRSILPDLGEDDLVYLLSAYSNPSWIFKNQDESRELNVVATKRVIDEVTEVGARIIFMSSVEVFDGVRGNYNEKSIPSPLSTG